MFYDGITMAAVCHELSQRLLGARLERIYQPLPQDIHLYLRTSKGNFVLACSADARLPRVHLTWAKLENPPSPPPFCMLLRKHLSGARLLSVRQQEGLERVLVLTFRAYDELGRETRKHLICEVMGKHSNIILVVEVQTGQWLIQGSIKTVAGSRSRHRQVLPGEPYIPPPTQVKLSLFDIREEDLASSLPAEGPGDKLLVNAVMGIGLEVAGELLFRAGDGQLLHPLEVLRPLTVQLHKLAKTVQNGIFEPCSAHSTDGKIIAFAPIKLTRYPAASLAFYNSVNEMLDTCYNNILCRQRETELRRELLQVARAALARAEKKRFLQERELQETAGAELFRLYGEMLTASLYQINQGQKEAVVTNYYSPGTEKIRIPLNPALSPQENARRYFKKYRKLKDGEVVLRRRLAETLDEEAYLATILASLDHADATSLAEIREEMEQYGLLRPSPRHKKPKQPSAPLRFVSQDGIDIYVGKNNRQNDLLTLKLASPNDTWLHTKDIPGAHVIVKSPDPPGPTLLFAAKLAVRYSRAAASANVPVDYTLARHVRKPRGAKPGMVIYDNHRTIYVTVD